MFTPKPQTPIINWGNPITQGLKYAYSFTGNGLSSGFYSSATKSVGTINAATWTTGAFGSELTFTAANPSNVTLDWPWNFSATDSLSIAFWAKVSSTTGTGQKNFIGQFLGSGNFPEFTCTIGVSTAGVPGVYISGTTAGNSTISGGSDMRDDKWHFYVYRRQGPATATIDVYVDNVRVATGTDTTTGGVNTTGSNVKIGAESGTGFPWECPGMFIWNRLLTLTEIKSLYTNINQIYRKPNFVFAYPAAAAATVNSNFFAFM